MVTRIHQLILLLCLTAFTVRAEVPPADDAGLFDEQRHMRVSEVKRGMRGYGLTVFQQTKIERFEVEVVDVLRNFNPKHDVVLIRCEGDFLKHTGAIAGMSGSPIYLKDESGRERMIGAFAYGWPLMKDPLAGVQPIEYMLKLPTQPKVPEHAAAIEKAGADTRQPQGRIRWSLSDAIALPGMTEAPKSYPLVSWNRFEPNPKLLTGDGDDAATRLRPLATPLMASGLSPELLEQIGPIFKARGLVPLQAGAVGQAKVDAAADTKIEPGSVLAVPLLTGDASPLQFTAVGTCTEVIGDKVFGFGHEFTNEGSVTLPMGGGYVNAVIANLMTSFKIGGMTRVQGTLAGDQVVGVSGTLGDVPPMVPIDLRIVYADGSQDIRYSFQSALHPAFTPLISATALASAVTGAKDLPQYHTLDYDLELQFANGTTIKLDNTTVNADVGELFFEIGGPLIAASENPFERVMVKKISGTVRVTPEAREAQILSINIPRAKYRPGETVKAFVAYRPFRAAEAILPIEFNLPKDLPEGTYQLVISDWQRFVQDEMQARPFRFTAENVGEVFDVLKDFTGIRHDAMYLRLLRQPDGIAVGRTAMPHLPSSRRQVMMGAGRSNITPFVSSTVQTVPTPFVMSGEADFSLTIDKDAKVEVAPRAGAPAAAKPAEAEPKSDESKNADESKKAGDKAAPPTETKQE